jgi:hypothetical protein
MEHADLVNHPHHTVVVWRHGGSHLILPLAKQLSPLPIVDAEKLKTFHPNPKGQTILFWRDPRNRIVSTYRWIVRNKPKKLRKLAGFSDDERIASLIRRREHKTRQPAHRGLSFLQAMRSTYDRWSAEPGAHIFRFESMIDPEDGPAEACVLALALDSQHENPEALWHEIIGSGSTFTGSHSDWRDWFGPMATEAWEAEGGDDLVDLMEYER